MTEIQELALTESRSLRAQYADRTDVLDKIKALSLLPDGIHADVPAVANYYEVSIETIKSLVKDNRRELMGNGFATLRGESLRSLKDLGGINAQTSSLAVFPRRAILNVGQLLTESPIAKAVRTYLLDVEEIAAPEVRSEAAERAALSRVQVLMLKAAEGLVDSAWLTSKAKVVLARGLGEEPEIDPLDVPLYVPDFIKSQGVTRKADIESIQSWFGRRVASLCEAEYGEKPSKRVSELPNGSMRETYAWTKRHLPFFEEAWDRWYAAEYAPQGDLFAIQGGA
jgi:hypothetical protein